MDHADRECSQANSDAAVAVSDSVNSGQVASVGLHVTPGGVNNRFKVGVLRRGATRM